VSVSASGSGNNLQWGAASDSIVGYHVYRANSASGPFSRVTSSLVTGTSYTDPGAPANATYMVRAIKLENTTSGSYYNPSQGTFSTVGTGGSGGSTGGGGGTTPPPSGGGGGGTVSGTLWVDDSVPTGAVPGSDGGDS